MEHEYLHGRAFVKKSDGKIQIFETPYGLGDLAPVLADGTTKPRMLKDRFADVVNVRDFGAVGDGVHDDTAAIQAAIVFANGKLVYIPAGVYKATDRIVVYESCSGIVGEGVSQWDMPSSVKTFKWNTGTTVVFSGTPSHFHYVKNVTNQSLTGGSPVNPDDESEVYELLDYTNQDASNSKATYKSLKCGFVLERHNNVLLRDFRIMVSCRGLDGYNLIDTKKLDDRILGDDYDIGLLISNCSFVLCQNVQVVGYWRMTGLAHINSDEFKNFSEATYNSFHNCYFQGLAGASIRATDALPIISHTDNSVTVPFSVSNLLDTTSGTVFLGKPEWRYTSTTISGDTITLTGDAFPENAGLTEVRLNLPNFGLAGTAFYGCVFTGLAHSSRCRAKDVLGKLGCAVEISGFPLRDVDFYNCHFFDSECVIHLHDCEDISFTGCFAEALGARDDSHNWIASGARFIVSGEAEAHSNSGKYPMAGCTNLVLDASSELAATVDRYPVYRNKALTRFTSTTGLYKPSFAVDFLQKQGLSVVSGTAWNVPATLRTLNRRGLRVVNDDFSVKFMISENGSVSVNPNVIPDSIFPLTVNGLYETETANNDVRLRGTSTGIQFQSTGSGNRWCRIATYGGTWRFMKSTGQTSSYETCFFVDNNSVTFTYTLRPVDDNVIDLGTGSRKWKNIYASTGTINTSDERAKQNIVDPSEALMRAWGKVNFKVFQFKDAVEKKGADARLHVGVIAQQVIDAFASEGLDATRYGLLCYDKWEDEYEDVEVIDQVEVADEEGNIVTPAKTHIEHRLVTPAGDRYGIRYEEALALEAAYQRWKLQKIESTLVTMGVKL